MFKRPLLSNLIYTKRQIVIHAFTVDHIHPGKFMPIDLTKIDYKKLKFNDNYHIAITNKKTSKNRGFKFRKDSFYSSFL